MPDKRTILIAGMGTSPAVHTETVWALCHREKAKASLKESCTAAHKALMKQVLFGFELAL